MNDKKIAIALKQDLLSWQKLNVVSFLSSGVAIKFPETHGPEFITADGKTFLPFLNRPVLIFQAETTRQLQQIFYRSEERELHIGIFSEQLFQTNSGTENSDEIARHNSDSLDLVGIIVFGETQKVNQAFKGLRLHK